MLSWLSQILIKIIPDNWYSTKKTCDVITKLCDTVIELRWFVFPTVVVVVAVVGIAFVYWCRWRIEKIRAKF
jgi:hypothetical protein